MGADMKNICPNCGSEIPIKNIETPKYDEENQGDWDTKRFGKLIEVYLILFTLIVIGIYLIARFYNFGP
jgi:hypothetical protein